MRNSGLIYFDLYGAGRVWHFSYKLIQTLGGKVLHYFFAECIGAHSAHHAAWQSELGYVIGKIGRRTADLLAFGQNIPQGLTHSYYHVYVVHIG